MTRLTMNWFGEISRSRAVFSMHFHCFGVTLMFFWMVCGIGFYCLSCALRGVIWPGYYQCSGLEFPGFRISTQLGQHLDGATELAAVNTERRYQSDVTAYCAVMRRGQSATTLVPGRIWGSGSCCISTEFLVLRM